MALMFLLNNTGIFTDILGPIELQAFKNTLDKFFHRMGLAAGNDKVIA